MHHCGVVGCGHTNRRNKEFRYFRIPTEISKGGIVDLRKRERRKMWIEALGRKDLTETMLKNMRICSAHFSSGKPAPDDFPDHPDYVPSQNMGDRLNAQQPKSVVHQEGNKCNQKRSLTKHQKSERLQTKTRRQPDLTCAGMSREVSPDRQRQTRKVYKRSRKDGEAPTHEAESLFCGDSTTPSGSIWDEHNYCIRKQHVLDLQDTIAYIGPLCSDLQKQIKQMEKVIKSRDEAKTATKIEQFHKWTHSRGLPEAFKLFTGLDNEQFLRLLHCLRPAYHDVRASRTLSGHFNIPLSLEDQLFLVLGRLRLGDPVIQHSFNISDDIYDQIWELWLMVLHEQLSRIPVWPNSEPGKSRRLILDCVNVGEAGKFLLVARCSGLVTFVSDLYDTEISNVEVIKKSGILQLLETGDAVFADDGFRIEPLLEARGARAEGRHKGAIIERVIGELRDFKILTLNQPSSSDVMRIWKICCLLLNFKRGNFPR